MSKYIICYVRGSILLIGWIWVLSSAVLIGQPNPNANSNADRESQSHNALPKDNPYETAEEFGPDHRVIKESKIIYNESGEPVHQVQKTIQLETGLHYWSEADSNWKASREEIEILEDGSAIARHGRHQVKFKADFGQPQTIELTLPDGQSLVSHVAGLGYYDAKTGQSVLLAEAQGSLGWLVAPNQIVYPNAFKGLHADVRYTWKKGSFEQDIILLENPPPPRDYGLNDDSSRLEVMTEFIDPPQPHKNTKKLKGGKHGGNPNWADPEWTDEYLDFGEMQMGPGNAFALKDEKQPGKKQIQMGKRWIKQDNRDILIEQLPYEDARARLEELPDFEPPGKAGKNKNASIQRSVPSRQFTQTTPPASDSSSIRIASTPYDKSGFVLDYVILSSTSNISFWYGNTYYISGNVNLGGHTTINPGPNGPYFKFNSYATLVLVGDGASVYVNSGGKAVFTDKDDNSIGSLISGSSGLPSATAGYTAFSIEYMDQNFISLDNLDIRYAYIGLRYSFNNSTSYLYNTIFRDTTTGIWTFDSDVELSNISMCNVAAQFNQDNSSNVGPASAISTTCGGGGPCSGDAHGNSIAEASPIGLNSTTQAAIDCAGDEDYFRLDLNADGELTLYTSGSTDTYGTLKNSYGNDIWTNNDIGGGDANFYIYRTLSAGTYYLRVRHASSTNPGGNYSLQAGFTATAPQCSGDAQGGDVGTAGSINYGSSVNSAINCSGDEDFYQFTLSSSQYIHIYTTGSTDTYGYLIDSYGNQIPYRYNDDSGEGYNFSIYHSASAGTYYIRVRHYSTGTGAYTLHLGEPGCSNDVDGDGFGSATPMSVPATKYRAIDCPGDFDYFKFTLNQAEPVLLYTTGGTDTYGRLYYSNGSQIAYNDDGGAGLNFFINASLSSGTYYLQVKHYSSSGTGSYTLYAQYNNNAPWFLQDPILLSDSGVGAAYSGSLASHAYDPDGHSLTYSKTSGPAWLNVQSNGALTGTPSASDGNSNPNQFGVRVDDGHGGWDAAALRINVIGSVDSDNDGMLDSWETAYGLNPNTDDSLNDLDQDGINNLDEFNAGTLPNNADSDGDRMADGWEARLEKNPAVSDGWEIQATNFIELYLPLYN